MTIRLPIRSASLVCLFAVTVSPFSQNAVPSPGPPAPKVKLRLAETVSSANAKVGQPVLLEVIDPVAVDGKLVLASGAHARAVVTTARRRGRNHREGQLVLTVESVSRVDGGQARLQSAAMKKGSGEAMPIFGPCTFPLPADPVGLFRKGTDVVIPKGTELTASIALGAS